MHWPIATLAHSSEVFKKPFEGVNDDGAERLHGRPDVTLGEFGDRIGHGDRIGQQQPHGGRRHRRSHQPDDAHQADTPSSEAHDADQSSTGIRGDAAGDRFRYGRALHM